VIIEPFPGDLKDVSGSVPHPKGKISVGISKRKNNKTSIRITLPKEVDGNLIWKGKTYHLSGKEEYNFEL
jgi:hypothetical protein